MPTYERAEDEWYPEEPWVTELLLKYIPKPVLVCDPCCGEGNILKACADADIPAFGFDIVERGSVPNFAGIMPFEQMSERTAFAPTIISNPPYENAKGTERFIRTMLGIGGVETLAVLGEARMMFSKSRALGLWSELPPRLIITIAPRPSIPPGQGLLDGTIKRGGGKQDYVWFVWSRLADFPVGWIAGHIERKKP
jgi:hypothetical protein